MRLTMLPTVRDSDLSPVLFCNTALVVAGVGLSDRPSDFSQLMSVKSAGRNKKIKYL